MFAKVLSAAALLQISSGQPANPKCLLGDSWTERAKVAMNATQGPLKETALPKGPYEVKTGTIENIPGLSLGGPYSAYVIYAVPKKSGEKLPFISFAHGTTAGAARLLSDYRTDLELVASYGFVIVAAQSCPLKECYSGYCKDQQATIRACAKDRSLHPALANADFSNVGIYGHSMGAMSTLASVGGSDACKYDSSLNIKAAVSQHVCDEIHGPATMDATNITVPVMFTTGTADTSCQDGCAQKFYDQMKHSKSKIMFDIRDINHFDPTNLGPNVEVPPTAYFFSCWLRNEDCDKVYGSSGKEICKQIPFGFSLQQCTVEGKKANADVVV